MTELEAIEAAAERLHDSLAPTPQICWPLLSSRCNCEVWVKHENHTSVGAFKVRGGLLYVEDLHQRHPDLEAIVLATRGNHGQSIAYACRRYALRPIVVVPQGNSQEKNRSMKGRKVGLILSGGNVDAEVYARIFSKSAS